MASLSGRGIGFAAAALARMLHDGRRHAICGLVLAASLLLCSCAASDTDTTKKEDPAFFGNAGGANGGGGAMGGVRLNW
jgi:hypothetical protein